VWLAIGVSLARANTVDAQPAQLRHRQSWF
jgi:hypothetical protein